MIEIPGEGTARTFRELPQRAAVGIGLELLLRLGLQVGEVVVRGGVSGGGRLRARAPRGIVLAQLAAIAALGGPEVDGADKRKILAERHLVEDGYSVQGGVAGIGGTDLLEAEEAPSQPVHAAVPVVIPGVVGTADAVVRREGRDHR